MRSSGEERGRQEGEESCLLYNTKTQKVVVVVAVVEMENYRASKTLFLSFLSVDLVLPLFRFAGLVVAPVFALSDGCEAISEKRKKSSRGIVPYNNKINKISLLFWSSSDWFALFLAAARWKSPPAVCLWCDYNDKKSCGASHTTKFEISIGGHESPGKFKHSPPPRNNGRRFTSTTSRRLLFCRRLSEPLLFFLWMHRRFQHH